VVQRRDRPRWLREHDDDDDDDDEMAMERAGKDTAAHISHLYTKCENPRS